MAARLGDEISGGAGCCGLVSHPTPRRLRELAAELEALSLAEMARAEGWAKITPGTPAPPRTRPVRGPNPNYPKPPKTPGDQHA